MMIKRTLLSILVCSSSYSYGCDACAGAAITAGFAAINTAVASLSASVNSLNMGMETLGAQIEASTLANTASVNAFSTAMGTSMATSTQQISMMVSGLTSTIEGTMKLNQKIESDLALSLENHITETAKNVVKQKLKIDGLYKAGGARGHFPNGDQVTGIFMVYESALKKSKLLYLKNSEFIKNWNLRGADVGQGGRRAVLNSAKAKINAQKPDLLFQLANLSTLSKESYADFMTYLTLGVNPDQITPDNPKFIDTNVYQSQLLTKVMYKAPIVGITDATLDIIRPSLVSKPLPPEECPEDEVMADAHCTSLYNLLESLAYRTASASYANDLALASERAILEELNRSMTVSNMLSRFDTHLRAYYAENPTLN